MGEWEKGKWRRGLFDRELEVSNEFSTLINKVTLQQGANDKWSWKAEKNCKYKTRTTYSVLSFGTAIQAITMTTKPCMLV